MTDNRTKRNTFLFIAFLLLAGIANLFTKTDIHQLNQLMTCVNHVIYVGLLLFWIESVRVRLLPSAARTGILCAAALMVLYMLLRSFKYSFTEEPVVMRYIVYAYWIPQLLIPALFLMTCIRIRRGTDKQADRKARCLLLPAALLALIVMTNDLHALVYVPKIGLSDFAVATGTYSHGPVFYLLYVWMILAVCLGLMLLFHWVRRFPKEVVRYLLIVVSLWFGYLALFSLVIDRIPNSNRLFNMPESNTFGLLGVFEVCIRFKLIPYNENYSGFFRKLQIPVLITDKAFQPAYHSEAVLTADRHDLEAAAKEPVYLSPDQKLCGKQIVAGCAFWTEDESAVHQAQTRLLEANEIIGQENDLIRAETEQKEKDAYLQSRHRIYHEIAEELYPCQKRIAQILSEAVPGSESFQEKIALVSVLNAYVKRKTNLLLLASEKESFNLSELLLALQESAGYLTLAGMQTSADMQKDETLPSDRILALYDAFEHLAEQLLGEVPSMMVSLSGSGLRLAVKADRRPDTAEIRLPVIFRESEDILYITVSAQREGDRL